MYKSGYICGHIGELFYIVVGNKVGILVGPGRQAGGVGRAHQKCSGCPSLHSIALPCIALHSIAARSMQPTAGQCAACSTLYAAWGV